jgi:membrane-bound lytic murein transglycosylase B
LRRCSLIAAALAALLAATPAMAQRAACHKGASFEQWLDQFKRDAVAEGVSPRTFAAASHHMDYDQ